MNLPIISLFTGAGGLDAGFEQHGFHPIVCVDNDPEACRTLARNRPHWNVYCGDIARFTPPRIRAIGCVGGPPCQGFSPAGKGNPSDPRNQLWREYFRIVAAVKPEFVVLENVPGMLHEKNRGHFCELIDALESEGFTVNYGVVNAADFGVPQNRRRLLVLAGRGFFIELPKPTVRRHVTASQAIGDLERVSSGIPNHQPNNHAPHVVRRWSKLKEGEADPNYRRARIYADRPSPTIRAGGGYGPRGDHLAGFHPPIHYKLPRQLTVRESARLQGFDDKWIFEGCKTAQGRQVGNAVPPPLAAAVAKTVLDALPEKAKSRSASKARSRRPATQLSFA